MYVCLCMESVFVCVHLLFVYNIIMQNVLHIFAKIDRYVWFKM